MKIYYYFITLAFVAMMAAPGCSGGSKTPPAKIAANYEFDSSTSLEDRVSPPPEMVLDYYRDFDKDYITEDSPYLAYTPTEEEMEDIRETLASMPGYYRERLRERLLGIYFIENFLGSGMADFVKGKDGDYFIMLFNPSTLKKDASQWITEKEKSAFEIDDPSYDIRIDIGDTGSGFYYIFYHEITHVIDYIEIITPGEPGFKTEKEYVEKVKAGKSPGYEFVDGVWLEFKKPVPEYDFQGRADVTFYGIDGGPKLKISEAPELYDRLQQTPFVTLYGSMSWMEDLAEFMAMYVNSEIMKRPWKLQVLKDGEVIYEMSDVLRRENLADRLEIAGRLTAKAAQE